MFRSTFIPTMEDDTVGVFHTNKYFDFDHLVRAVQLLMSGEDSDDNGTHQHLGKVSFDDLPGQDWPIFEIFMANKVLSVATKTGFWFTPVRALQGTPCLFVSIPFNDNCVVINAMTSASIIVRDPLQTRAMQSLKSRATDYVYLQQVFDMLSRSEDPNVNVLKALKVTDLEGGSYMVVNLFTFPLASEIDSYGVEILEEMDSLLRGRARETESLVITPQGIKRKDLNYWPIIPRVTAQQIVDTYHEIVEQRSNYTPIYDINQEDYLYWSTNQRYLVRANTLECVVVNNQHLKNLLNLVADGGACDRGNLDVLWNLACQA